MSNGKPDSFEAYFKSDLHTRRVDDATRRAVEKLTELGKDDLLPAFSEAIGMLFGVAHFYRTLGLKHQFALIFTRVYAWSKKGTD